MGWIPQGYRYVNEAVHGGICFVTKLEGEKVSWTGILSSISLLLQLVRKVTSTAIISVGCIILRDSACSCCLMLEVFKHEAPQ